MKTREQHRQRKKIIGYHLGISDVIGMPQQQKLETLISTGVVSAGYKVVSATVFMTERSIDLTDLTDQQLKPTMALAGTTPERQGNPIMWQIRFLQGLPS